MGLESGPVEEIPRSSKLFLCALCSLGISSTALVMRQAEHHDAIGFSPIAASFFAEAIKMMAAIVIVLQSQSLISQLKSVSFRSYATFTIPAFLYVLMNNMRFFLVRAVNPGLLQVVKK